MTLNRENIKKSNNNFTDKVFTEAVLTLYYASLKLV